MEVAGQTARGERCFLAFQTLSSSLSAFREAGSDDSPRRSEPMLFRIEFSDLHVSKEDPVKPWCDQLECQLFEAEYLADKDPVLVPADVAAIVHPSQKETLRVGELRQLARQSN